MSGLFGTEIERSAIKSVEWYTPEWVFDELALQFDLDPASPHDMETAVPAVTKYTIFDDGLSRPWHGRVWLNPPLRERNPAMDEPHDCPRQWGGDGIQPNRFQVVPNSHEFRDGDSLPSRPRRFCTRAREPAQKKPERRRYRAVCMGRRVRLSTGTNERSRNVYPIEFVMRMVTARDGAQRLKDPWPTLQDKKRGLEAPFLTPSNLDY